MDACDPFAQPEPDIADDLDGVDLNELAAIGEACWANDTSLERFKEAFGAG